LSSAFRETQAESYGCRVTGNPGRPPHGRGTAAGRRSETRMSDSAEDDSSEPGGEDLMNKQQLARRLGKCPRTIDNWRKHDGLPFYRIKHSVYFKWKEVMAHLRGARSA
jgi:hypothetical protein